jgi:hypothetical protein
VAVVRALLALVAIGPEALPCVAFKVTTSDVYIAIAALPVTLAPAHFLVVPERVRNALKTVHRARANTPLAKRIAHALVHTTV